ncbi:MAG: hypothetical protein ABIA75_06480 [Candidatus Neomarinimicrobiota bacterium]
MTTENSATIVLIRHGEAAGFGPDGTDFSRPLAVGAKFDIGTVAADLVAAGLKPDLIVTSPARRAAETAALFSRETGFTGKIRSEPLLYNDAAETVINLVEKYSIPELTLYLVGHNPSITRTVATLVPNFNHGFDPATAAAIRIRHWPHLNECQLIGLYRP